MLECSDIFRLATLRSTAAKLDGDEIDWACRAQAVGRHDYLQLKVTIGLDVVAIGCAIRFAALASPRAIATKL